MIGKPIAYNLATPVSITVTGNSAVYVDLKDLEGEIVIVLQAMNTAGTNPTLDVALKDSASETAGAAVNDPDGNAIAFTQVTDANDPFTQTLRFNKRLFRRYLHLSYTVGGTNSPAFTVSAVVVGNLARN